MPSLSFFKFRFTLSYPMLILALLFIFLFLCLGFWQIHRAQEKRQMIVAQKTQKKQNPVLWTKKQKLPLQYARILLEGKYLPFVFLLDNQHYQHQFGYNVLSPLELDDGSVILIDRGWVPGEPTRRVLPNIQTPNGLIKIDGSVYFPSNNKWILGSALDKRAKEMTIIEYVDKELISQILQKSVYPFIMRLSKQDANGFVREWKTVSMPPQRHLAYAVQWFVMALVVLIIFISLNLKKKDAKTSF